MGRPALRLLRGGHGKGGHLVHLPQGRNHQGGESFNLRLRSSEGETASVSWSANKSGYVSISGNKITGKAKGTVTVSCEHEGVAYECIVRVKSS